MIVLHNIFPTSALLITAVAQRRQMLRTFRKAGAKLLKKQEFRGGGGVYFLFLNFFWQSELAKTLAR